MNHFTEYQHQKRVLCDHDGSRPKQDHSIIMYKYKQEHEHYLAHKNDQHFSILANMNGCSFFTSYQFSSVHFSRSVVSNSLWPHGLQHARLPCPSPTPRVYPNSCPLSRWCHPTISSSVVPFSSCLRSFPASGSFQMSRIFASGGQSIGVSASTSILTMNTLDWSPLGWARIAMPYFILPVM